MSGMKFVADSLPPLTSRLMFALVLDAPGRRADPCARTVSRGGVVGYACDGTESEAGFRDGAARLVEVHLHEVGRGHDIGAEADGDIDLAAFADDAGRPRAAAR